MTIERVVVDTNVLISAALRPQGTPRAVLDLIQSMNGVLIFSDETFSELQSRLNRPKFDRYVSQDLRRIWLSQLEAVSEWVAITGVRLGCRDPDDDKVLETALIGDVSFLVNRRPRPADDSSTIAKGADFDAFRVSGATQDPIAGRKSTKSSLLSDHIIVLLCTYAFLILACCIRINSRRGLTFGRRYQ